MLKLGIVAPTQLNRPFTRLGKRKHVSLLLLRDLFESGSQNAEHYNTVITNLHTPNGTWKETQPQRFTLLDRTTLDLLRQHRPTGGRLTIADLAVSTGVTSVELFRVLSSAFTIDFVATDLWRDAIAVRSLSSGWAIIFDARGHELQHVLGRFVLQGQGNESAFYPVNRVLRALSRRLIVPAARAALRAYDPAHHGDFEATYIDGYEITKLPLLSYDALTFPRHHPNYRFTVADVLEPLPLRADVIRAMNVLTPIYFDDARLARGIGNCIDALNERGILILGRSPTANPADVRATIYLNDHGVLLPLKRLNGGYEAENVVERFTTPRVDVQVGAA